jgi:hypothetical protein
MNKIITLLYTILIITHSYESQAWLREQPRHRTSNSGGGACCSIAPTVCNNQAPCGPFLRPHSDDYDSWKDNTKIIFFPNPECAPRNDSLLKGYLYKGMWWDDSGARYWSVRNSTNNTINVQALNGGEYKDIPAGDVVNINRGESYTFRVNAPARLFELFNSEGHNIEIFINPRGFIDFRVENMTIKKSPLQEERSMHPKF